MKGKGKKGWVERIGWHFRVHEDYQRGGVKEGRVKSVRGRSKVQKREEEQKGNRGDALVRNPDRYREVEKGKNE